MEQPRFRKIVIIREGKFGRASPMLKKLGWQRIGIVVSVICFIGFAGYEGNNLRADEHDLKGNIFKATDQCVEAHTLNNNNPTTFEPIFQKCFRGARTAFIERKFVADFGVVVLLWLFGWSLIGIGQWVRREFA
jgi:hypothetical protein